MSLPLDPELCARIAHLRVSARSLADSVLAGAHPTRRIGSSVDFAEHREYRPGDDPRTLDTRVFARTDRWVVRRYQHEAEVRAELALDTSGSMQYRSRDDLPTKLQHGRDLLLGLGWLLLRQGDRVGAMDLDQSSGGSVPTATGASHLALLAARFERSRPGAATNLARSLELLAADLARRALVVIATDAIDEASALTELARLRASGHTVVLLHVLDPMELEFDLEGSFEFCGLESEGRVVADVAQVREAYLREVRAFVESTRARCDEAGARYLLARTDHPAEQTLSELVAGGALE